MSAVAVACGLGFGLLIASTGLVAGGILVTRIAGRQIARWRK